MVDLLTDEAFWRDMLALTWDYHTYEGRDTASRFLADQLLKYPSTYELREDLVELQTRFEGLAWIQDYFTFDTTVGHTSWIFRLVLLANCSWKGHMVYTHLEDPRGFREKIRPSNPEENHGESAEARKKEQEHLDEEPSVIVVGGGQSGLDAAARLKTLDVNALIIERNERHR